MLTSPHLVTLRAGLAAFTFELAGIRLQLLLRKANFNPGQLRDETGRWITEGDGDGLVHDIARRRSGPRGTSAQEARLAISAAAARAAVRRVRELDPQWRPPRSFTSRDSIEGEIRHQEATALAAEARLAEVLPRGFGTYERYVEFGQSMRDGLRAAGYRDVEPMIRGSAVTGENFRTREPFDVRRVSDYDVALVSPALMRRAVDLGIPLRPGGTRTGPLSTNDLSDLGLFGLAHRLSRQMERDVNFMIYASRQSVTRRGPSRPILGK